MSTGICLRKRDFLLSSIVLFTTCIGLQLIVYTRQFLLNSSTEIHSFSCLTALSPQKNPNKILLKNTSVTNLYFQAEGEKVFFTLNAQRLQISRCSFYIQSFSFRIHLSHQHLFVKSLHCHSWKIISSGSVHNVESVCISI